MARTSETIYEYSCKHFYRDLLCIEVFLQLNLAIEAPNTTFSVNCFERTRIEEHSKRNEVHKDC